MTAWAWAAALRDEAKDWAAGRSPAPRAVLLAYLAYAGCEHVKSGIGGEYCSWFAGITLAFHELGHLVFLPTGRTWMLLGGSIFQLLVPAAAGLYLLFKQHDWFGVSVCGVWLSTSLFELATYIDDANRLNLPLVGLGDDVLHDWETLLTQWHLLNQAQLIAAATHALAIAVWAASMMFGAWLLLQMWCAKRSLA
jgi:hypothetical protein